jgi:hypothetical protein
VFGGVYIFRKGNTELIVHEFHHLIQAVNSCGEDLNMATLKKMI